MSGMIEIDIERFNMFQVHIAVTMSSCSTRLCTCNFVNQSLWCRTDQVPLTLCIPEHLTVCSPSHGLTHCSHSSSLLHPKCPEEMVTSLCFVAPLASTAWCPISSL